MNLFNYQKHAINFILEKKKCLICLQMGLGKTLITLKALERILMNSKKKVLILAPKSVAINTWSHEIEKWNIKLTYANCVKSLKDILKYDISIVNHDKINKLIELEIFNKFDILIIDESTYYKNTQAKRTKLLCKNSKHFEYIIALSGTPITKDYIDIYSQIYILDNGTRLGKNKTTYLKDHFYCKNILYNQYELKDNHDELIKVKINDICFNVETINNNKLPILNNIPIYIDLKEELKNYIKLKRSALYNYEIDNKEDKIFVRNLVLKLQQFTSGFLYTEKGIPIKIHNKKAAALKNILKKDTNYLIAYKFNYEIEIIKSIIPNATLFSADVIDKWNKGEIKYLLCNPATTSMGLNLQFGGHNIIWWALPWDYATYTQFNARLYRKGQINNVNIYTLQCLNTIDIQIYKVLIERQNNLENFLNDIIKC